MDAITDREQLFYITTMNGCFWSENLKCSKKIVDIKILKKITLLTPFNLAYISSIIWQKGESQNRGNKKTKFISGNFACLVFLLPPFSDSPFCLNTIDMASSTVIFLLFFGISENNQQYVAPKTYFVHYIKMFSHNKKNLKKITLS